MRVYMRCTNSQEKRSVCRGLHEMYELPGHSAVYVEVYMRCTRCQGKRSVQASVYRHGTIGCKKTECMVAWRQLWIIKSWWRRQSIRLCWKLVGLQRQVAADTTLSSEPPKSALSSPSHAPTLKPLLSHLYPPS